MKKYRNRSRGYRISYHISFKVGNEYYWWDNKKKKFVEYNTESALSSHRIVYSVKMLNRVANRLLLEHDSGEIDVDMFYRWSNKRGCHRAINYLYTI